jgi:catechol 2,3-dioxygenase-like lactoylglutathione lyase family enzyme
MLGNPKPVAMLGTTQPDRARPFFQDVLGLTFVEDTQFALIFDIGGITLRVSKMDEVSPPRGTALGFAVADVRATVKALKAKGVVFERFDGMGQDDDGIWHPAGPESGVAWFKDPDGNLLSVSHSGR